LLLYRAVLFVHNTLLLKFELQANQMENKKRLLDEAEITHLKEGLKRSYKERFEMATRLYKVQQTMNKAVISHKPYISK
jgi:outer membrane protein assembly factor BamA